MQQAFSSSNALSNSVTTSAHNLSYQPSDKLPISLGTFSMEIVEAREHITQDDGSVIAVMEEGAQYKIRLKNHLPCKTDVELKVDGKTAGFFRLNAKQCWAIERPSSQPKKFTFYSVRNVLAAQQEMKTCVYISFIDCD